ncbi:hypothetical protein [Mesorhizobium neociceri]|uniref:Uncharacterized protein n=1 Tax=Mesorhizobium neociceri TaxID=1307853 RepID=A0A838BDY4_9HYPH|nr:hypothetical protein [Mesorhizobium neociceri]MBA1144463.1 hypothetical protein [Mesorhizobium neociceri]
MIVSWVWPSPTVGLAEFSVKGTDVGKQFRLRLVRIGLKGLQDFQRQALGNLSVALQLALNADMMCRTTIAYTKQIDTILPLAAPAVPLDVGIADQASP